MQIITGRVTKDAEVKTLQDGRQLIAFTIVLNERYKVKSGEVKESITFYSCSFWVSTKIAPALRKGTIVSVFGHVGLNKYKDRDGEFFAFLTFHVNTLKIIAFAKKDTAPATGNGENKKDLPF